MVTAFQSLLGRLKTTMLSHAEVLKRFLFQSLLGRLKTDFVIC